jgi:hypothetical protein
MGTIVLEQSGTEQLAVGLRRVAADPRLTHRLHELLGGYCHQCRNLLHSLKLSLYLARRSGGPAGEDSGDAVWVDVEPRYLELERVFDRLHQVCRPMPLSPVRLGLDMLIDDRRDDWSRTLAERGQGLEIERLAGDLFGGFDPVRLGQGLDDLVTWRSRAGRPGNVLRLRYGAGDGSFKLDWDETRPAGARANPGPAAADPDVEAVTTRAYGVLTVPVLARVMALHGGDLETADRGRWWLRLRWPLAARTP